MHMETLLFKGTKSSNVDNIEVMCQNLEPVWAFEKSKTASKVKKLFLDTFE